MAVLIVERFSDTGKIDFPIQTATLPIICFKVSQVDFTNKCVLQSLYIVFIIANSADPDEMQQPTKLPFHGLPVYKGFIPHIIRQVQSSTAPGSETTRPRALILCL